MASSEHSVLLAADVGNSRVKLGLFAAPTECETHAASGVLPIAVGPLPAPSSELAIAPERFKSGDLADWLAAEGIAACDAVIASVCPPAEQALLDALATWAERDGGEVSLTSLRADDVPLDVGVAAPDRVGIDRLVAAAAANRLRKPTTPAIVIDIGTAITVDLVTADGLFGGGAILPGPTLAGRALAERTAFLPEISPGDLDSSPDAVGANTEEALLAGLYWGTVGALRELIARQRDRLTTAPQVFLTGGASPAFARLIGGPDYTVRYVSSLTLSGIALAAAERSESPS